MKLSQRAILARVLEQYDLGLFTMLAVLLTVLSDESGTEAISSGLRSLVLVALFYGFFQLILQIGRWWTYELHLEDESIVVCSGIVRPKRRRIPFDRIQHSAVSTTTVSRLFGLAALECETAGNPDEADVSVRYLEPEDAEALQQRIRSGADAVSSQTSNRSRIFTLGTRALVLYSVARLHLRTVLPAVLTGAAVLYFELESAVGLRSIVVALFSDLLPLSSAVTLGLVAIGGWLVGVVLAVERMAMFRLSAGDASFRRRHGLLRTIDADVSTDRIQVARIRSNPLHRIFGIVQADVGTAGLSGALPFGLQWPLAPLARRDVAWNLVERAAGASQPTFQSLPAHARRRYVVRYCLMIIILTIVTAVSQQFVAAIRVIPLWSYSVLFVLAPLAGHVAWTHRGYALLDDAIVVRYGFWTQRIYVVPIDNIQNLTISQSPLQKRVDLVSVRLEIASLPFLPGVPLPDISESVGGHLKRRFLETESSSERSSESTAA